MGNRNRCDSRGVVFVEKKWCGYERDFAMSENDDGEFGRCWYNR